MSRVSVVTGGSRVAVVTGGSRVAVVTGGSRGIGRAVALRLARDGYALAITYSKDASAATAAVEEIRSLGGKGLALKADAGNPADMDAARREVEGGLGPADLLVNNVGGSLRKPFLEATDDEWRAVIDRNLGTAIISSRVFGEGMVARGSGSIVNVASIAGVRALRNRWAYSAAKAAVMALTRSLASEWVARGVRVNAVAPGIVMTEGVKGLIEAGSLDPKEMTSRVPMARFARPEEIAALVAFLGSEDASYITGQTIFADGGLSIEGGF